MLPAAIKRTTENAVREEPGAESSLSRRELLCRCGAAALGAVTLAGCQSSQSAAQPAASTSNPSGGGTINNPALGPSVTGGGLAVGGAHVSFTPFFPATTRGNFLVMALATNSAQASSPAAPSGWSAPILAGNDTDSKTTFLWIYTYFNAPQTTAIQVTFPNTTVWAGIVVEAVLPNATAAILVDATGLSFSTIGSGPTSNPNTMTNSATTLSNDLLLAFISYMNVVSPASNPSSYSGSFTNANHIATGSLVLDAASTTATFAGVQSFSATLPSGITSDWVTALVALEAA